ncbi:MAG TPA: ATP-binding protein [Jatrophihabitans sp.]|jgi:hypothetical protein|uniref:hybrid sensor histidine kinase/response regulator n=1 Tax=Jatrophihabitans sp. TaxID=1932789 RepID=UPI002E0176DF|nr:ATP-binding protein [Jatrophihabitans sp.]
MTQIEVSALDPVDRSGRAEPGELFEGAPDALVGVGDDGRIHLLNAQASRLFGWQPQELIGRPIEWLVPSDVVKDHATLRAAYTADPAIRPMGAGKFLLGRRKDGSTFTAEISLSPVRDAAGEPLVLAAVRDVTERVEQEHEQERRALETQRLESLGHLAGGVAHDFNNLLGVILNYATLIARRVEDPVVVADLGEIRAAAERGAALTKQLLAFARRDVAHPEPLDVNAIARGVASMLLRTLGEHISFHLEVGDQPVIGVCDRTKLEQILMNLAINARDAMEGGGVLTVAVKSGAMPGAAGQRAAQISVRDTGEGMAPEVVAHAFEPFFTTKERGRGTGLGLAMVYGIVNQHHGQVTIDSAPGRGTQVDVWLPAAGSAVPAPEPEPDRPPGGTERVLVVEDKDALRRGTARLLTECGYDVLMACDGVEALEVIEREGDTIDVVLTDVVMPRMRGDELADRLRARPQRIPVIFMTGYDSKSGPLDGRVLAKPVAEDEMLHAIREALDV